MDKARAQKIVTLLLRDKVLVKVSEELVFHRSALEELRRLIAAQKLKSTKMDVAQVQGDDWGQPQVCNSSAGTSGPGARDQRVGDAREIL